MINENELGEFDFEGLMNEVKNDDSASDRGETGIVMQIVFAIDASNSMKGYKIGAVNDCVNNVISKLKVLDRQQGNTICISVIGFSSKLFRWTSGFIRASEFKYSYIEMVDGLSDMNAVFRELKDLTANVMHKEVKKFAVLFSDGLVTEDYGASLAAWKSSMLYPDIIKIAVVFEDDFQDPQSLEFFQDFVDTGAIIPVNKQEELLSVLLEAKNSYEQFDA